MEVAQTIYKICINVLILAFVSTLFGVIQFPIDIIYLIAVYLLFAVIILFHENLLTFLTVRKVFLTRLLSITIIASLLFLFYELTMPGFIIGPYTLDPQRYEFVTIESYTLNKYATIVLLGFFAGLVSSTLTWLEKSGKQS